MNFCAKIQIISKLNIRAKIQIISKLNIRAKTIKDPKCHIFAVYRRSCVSLQGREAIAFDARCMHSHSRVHLLQFLVKPEQSEADKASQSTQEEGACTRTQRRKIKLSVHAIYYRSKIMYNQLTRKGCSRTKELFIGMGLWYQMLYGG